jgi:hypothetical protein|uniref:Uncharacterized protein n=1 Tax=viral metagenome TaxID=1070528 RepID=A0A6C0IMC7_9ZZZZ
MKTHYPSLENIYNTNYVCKYKNINEINIYKNLMKIKNNDIDIDIDIESELYRLDLLNIFQIDSYKEKTISSTIDKIYDNFIEKNQNTSILKFKKILSEASQLFMSTDEKFGLTILYSYEYLDSAHKCVCELIQTNSIDENTLDTLEKEF